MTGLSLSEDTISALCSYHAARLEEVVRSRSTRNDVIRTTLNPITDEKTPPHQEITPSSAPTSKMAKRPAPPPAPPAKAAKAAKAAEPVQNGKAAKKAPEPVQNSKASKKSKKEETSSESEDEDEDEEEGDEDDDEDDDDDDEDDGDEVDVSADEDEDEEGYLERLQQQIQKAGRAIMDKKGKGKQEEEEEQEQEDDDEDDDENDDDEEDDEDDEEGEDEGDDEDDEDEDEGEDEDDDNDNDEDNDEDSAAAPETLESFALLSGVDPNMILPSPASTGKYINKQRCLLLSTRGVTSRQRHLLADLRLLIPHNKRESKVGDKQNLASEVLTIAELKSCNTALILECRKRQDVYLWLTMTPNGPSAKFHIANLHTMDELKLTGNCMNGSRPLLSFDRSFSELPHFQVLREMFVEVFGTPRGHPKSKPFVDRVMTFYCLDGKIWVRNYQVTNAALDGGGDADATAEQKAARRKDPNKATSLVEIGPRFVLDPIRIFKGAMGGQTLYQNGSYVSPNSARAEKMKIKGVGYANRKEVQKDTKERRQKIEKNMGRAKTGLEDVFR